MLWRLREPPPEPEITREDVNEMFGSLADIYATTIKILRILRGEDDEETEDYG